MTVWLFKNDPSLLRERMTGLGKPDQTTWDKVFMISISIVFIAWLVLMPLDAVRFQWTHMPIWLQPCGAIILMVSFYLFYLVYRENPYLSPAIRIQKERDQKVISSGLYRDVRHPMYAASVPSSWVLHYYWVHVMVLIWTSVFRINRCKGNKRRKDVTKRT